MIGRLTVVTLQMDRYWPEMALIAAEPENRRVIDIRSRDGDTEEETGELGTDRGLSVQWTVLAPKIVTLDTAVLVDGKKTEKRSHSN